MVGGGVGQERYLQYLPYGKLSIVSMPYTAANKFEPAVDSVLDLISLDSFQAERE